jgi:hypothetical protein
VSDANPDEALTSSTVHRRVWGKGPALFLARRGGLCCWCGGEVVAGDEACYWPEHDIQVAHEVCLRIVTLAEG